MKKTVIGIALAACVVSGLVWAAPQPERVPDPGIWTVEVRYEHPQMIELKTQDTGQVRRFWYVLMTATNNSGRDIDFYPLCELMTDTLQIIPQGASVAPAVIEQIKLLHQSQYPFLEGIAQTSNRLLQGENNAKELVMVWPDFDPNAREFSIFVGGLSNETAVIDHPNEKDQNGNPKKIYLRKTLQLDYTIPGEARFRDDRKIEFLEKSWVMR